MSYYRPAELVDPAFDLDDAKEAIGNGITADEPNDCDHVPQVGKNGMVRCANCGAKLR